MIELITNNVQLPISTEMKEADAIPTIESDEMLFYNAIKDDLQQLQMTPKAETIDSILNYSRNYAG